MNYLFIYCLPFLLTHTKQHKKLKLNKTKQKKTKPK